MRPGKISALFGVNVTDIHHSDSLRSGLAEDRATTYLTYSSTLLKSFPARKFLLVYTTSSFFDHWQSRTCTLSGLLLSSQTGYQSVLYQALSSRSTVCYLGENQSRYDTLTLDSTSIITSPHNLIHSTFAISHLFELHPLHQSHHLHSPLLTSLTPPSISSPPELNALSLPPWYLRQVRSQLELKTHPSSSSSTYHIHPTCYMLHQVHCLPGDD